MKANARQRAHRKCRRDSGIVGQATTDEPIDTRVRACYANSTRVLVGSGGARHRFGLQRLGRCRVFSPVVLEVALHRRHRATLAAGATKSEAAGADGNRGTAVPPFPQRYDCYGIENKNDGRTSEASGLITRPPNRVRLTLDLRKPRRSPRLRRKSYVHRLPPNMRHFRPPSTSNRAF